MDMWTSMMQPGIPIIEKMLRPLVVYFFLLIGLRLAGKRELAQLSAMDFIVLFTLSNTVQNAIIGPDNSLSGGLIGATTLLAINYATVRLSFNFKWLDRLIQGHKAVLIEHGKLRQKRMDKELVTREELEIQAHKQGIDSLEHVDRAVLEAGGVITFIRKEPGPVELRQSEIKAQLDDIGKQLTEIRGLVASRG